MGRRCGDAPHLAPYGNQRYGSPCFAILAQPTTVVTRLNNLAEDLIRCVRLAGKRTPSVWLGLRWCARVLAGYHFLLNISLSVGREIFDRQWDTTTGTALCSWRKREQDCDKENYTNSDCDAVGTAITFGAKSQPTWIVRPGAYLRPSRLALWPPPWRLWRRLLQATFQDS